jgi:hypothetical protein
MTSTGPGGAAPSGAVAIFENVSSPGGIGLSATDVCWIGGTSNPHHAYCGPKDGNKPPHPIDDGSDAALIADAIDIAVDATYVYWSNGTGNEVVRKPLGGGSSEPFFDGPQFLGYLVQVGSTFYVTGSDASSSSFSIVTGPMGGMQSNAIYTSLPPLRGIAVANDVIYWGQSDGLWSATVMANLNQKPSKMDVGGAASGVAVDASGTLYFLVDDQKLMTLAPGFANPSMLYDAGSSFGESDVAVDDTYVYWTEANNGRVMRKAK